MKAMFILLGVLLTGAGLQAATGTYLVPASGELASVAAISTECEISSDSASGRVSLVYTLPREIMDRKDFKVSLKMESPVEGGAMHFSDSEFAWAYCRGLPGAFGGNQESGTMECFVTAYNFERRLNQNVVGDFLKSKFTDPRDVDLRARLAVSFSNDPRGLISCPWTSKKDK